MTSPNPNWRPGNKIVSPLSDSVEIDPTTVSVPEMYKILIGAVTPRPIAFVSTVSSNGAGNLAPFSFFNAISSNPPTLMISVSRKPSGERKDTLRNIEETGQFVVNSANEWLIEPLVHCAASYPHGVDEMREVGLTPEPSLKVKPPRVKESAVSFECELLKLVEIGDGGRGSSVAVFGRVVMAHISKDAYVGGKVLTEKLKMIGRLGGTSYAKLGEFFDIPVPEV